MAKKKGRKKTSKKKTSRKKTGKKNLVRATKRKIQLVVRNLIVFGVLAAIFLGLYRLSNNEMLRSLFQLLSIVLGFVGLAFLIVLLALLVLKMMKK